MPHPCPHYALTPLRRPACLLLPAALEVAPMRLDDARRHILGEGRHLLLGDGLQA
jgi:hypothetical protein